MIYDERFSSKTDGVFGLFCGSFCMFGWLVQLGRGKTLGLVLSPCWMLGVTAAASSCLYDVPCAVMKK
jgi:hypothetical protein